jgi:hypothetical protein
LTFIEQLAALAPPPRAHQLTYHGVLAPVAGRRRLIAQITQSSVVTAMLSSLGLSSVAPRVHPARGPPLGLF